MPTKYVVKPYLENMHYHIFNRGANKQSIFRDKKDYWIFRRFVREALRQYPSTKCSHFALLPNHFHFLYFQENSHDLPLFMKKIALNYSMYFRRKYLFTGPLFESHYKAVALPQATDVERIRAYIQQNPVSEGLLRWTHLGESP